MRNRFSITSRIVRVVAVLTLGLVPWSCANAQIFEANYSNSTVGVYSLSGDHPEITSISGLSNPSGLAVDDGYLYVVNGGYGSSNSVSKYDISGDLTNGVPLVKANLITGLSLADSIAVANGNVFVTDLINGSINAYTTDGLKETLNLPTGLSVRGLAVAGNNLFVVNFGSSSSSTGSVSEYDLSDLTQSPTTVAHDLFSPIGIAIIGSTLFVAENGNGVIAQYSLDGESIPSTFLSDLDGPTTLSTLGDNLFVTTADGNITEYTTPGAEVEGAPLPIDWDQGVQGIAVAPQLISDPLDPPLDAATAPEPATWILTLLGLGLVVVFQTRRQISSRASSEKYA